MEKEKLDKLLHILNDYALRVAEANMTYGLPHEEIKARMGKAFIIAEGELTAFYAR